MRIGEMLLQVYGMIEIVGKIKAIHEITYAEYIHVIDVA